MNRRSEKRSPFNPASNYEEKVEVEGLTLWELNRPIWKTFPVPAEATDTIQKQKQASGVIMFISGTIIFQVNISSTLVIACAHLGHKLFVGKGQSEQIAKCKQFRIRIVRSFSSQIAHI